MQSAEALASLALVVVAVYIVMRQVAAVRAERALRESNQFAAEIIENAGEGIVVYDRDFHYLVWNHFMEELTGLDASEVLGKKAMDVFPHLREQHVDELLVRALSGESVAS